MLRFFFLTKWLLDIWMEFSSLMEQCDQRKMDIKIIKEWILCNVNNHLVPKLQQCRDSNLEEWVDCSFPGRYRINARNTIRTREHLCQVLLPFFCRNLGLSVSEWSALQPSTLSDMQPKSFMWLNPWTWLCPQLTQASFRSTRNRGPHSLDFSTILATASEVPLLPPTAVQISNSGDSKGSEPAFPSHPFPP